MNAAALTDILVGALMERWPATVPIFIRHRLPCPGCPMARFVTLSEAVAEHGVAFDALCRDILAVAPEAADDPA